ncbi:hypothetical protein N9L33_01890 [Nitrospinae bacterium]|nr:hypothetical protein [Nitrospinota bacterium]
MFSPLSPVATIDPFFLEKLHKQTTMVMLFSDGEYYFERSQRYYAQLSDLVMHIGNYNSKIGYDLLDIRTMHLHDYFDTACYKVSETREENIDMSFVGNIGQANRKQYLECFEQRGLSPEIYGAGKKWDCVF